jgi:hypothetical protein
MAPTRHLHAYLASLPDGMRSFPKCLVRGEVLDHTLEWLAEVEGTLDPMLRDWVRTYRPLGRAMQWVPEVLLNCVSLQVADAGYPSGEAWLSDVYRRQRAIYSTPLYRALLLVLSPTLLTMGASDRWKAYRRGSALVVGKWAKTPAGRQTTATLEHPPGLHTDLHLLSLGQALVAAVDACGAKGSKLELAPDSAPGQARFHLTYRA